MAFHLLSVVWHQHTLIRACRFVGRGQQGWRPRGQASAGAAFLFKGKWSLLWPNSSDAGEEPRATLANENPSWAHEPLFCECCVKLELSGRWVASEGGMKASAPPAPPPEPLTHRSWVWSKTQAGERACPGQDALYAARLITARTTNAKTRSAEANLPELIRGKEVAPSQSRTQSQSLGTGR